MCRQPRIRGLVGILVGAGRLCCVFIFIISCILIFTYRCYFFSALRTINNQGFGGLVGILVGAGHLCHLRICHHMYTDVYLLVLLFCSRASHPQPETWRVGRYFGGCWSPLPSSYLSSHVYWWLPTSVVILQPCEPSTTRDLEGWSVFWWVLVAFAIFIFVITCILMYAIWALYKK